MRKLNLISINHPPYFFSFIYNEQINLTNSKLRILLNDIGVKSKNSWDILTSQDYK